MGDGWLEEQYRAHNDLVRKTVPDDRLLIFNVKEGWEPLCDFLGKEVPDGVPFPNVNESADLKRARTVMRIVSYAWIPMVLATTAASLVLAFGCVSPSRQVGNERKTISNGWILVDQSQILWRSVIRTDESS